MFCAWPETTDEDWHIFTGDTWILLITPIPSTISVMRPKGGPTNMLGVSKDLVDPDPDSGDRVIDHHWCFNTVSLAIHIKYLYMLLRVAVGAQILLAKVVLPILLDIEKQIVIL